MDFSAYSSKRMLELFSEISAIPRPSGHEEKIADYIEQFARERHLEYSRDKENNLFVVVPATEGMENKEPIVLQGHTDMVCECAPGVVHDWEKDGVTLIKEGDILRADGTTLGGDDGFAVAIMLAIMDGAISRHPRVECLFTTDEERGMNGVIGFDCSKITAKRMLNLDCEDDETVTVSCAGGGGADLYLEYDRSDFDGVAMRITIDGLKSGHSGADIHLGRANANKLMAKVLTALSKATRMNIADITGGTKHNVIPRSCVATVAVFDKKKAEAALCEAEAEIRSTLVPDDAGMTFKYEYITDYPEKMFSRDDGAQIISFLDILPNGVLEYDNDLDMVKTSSNVGIVRTEGDKMMFCLRVRSNSDKGLRDAMYVVTMLSVSYGAVLEDDPPYPAWAYMKDSALREEWCDVYEKVNGKRPRCLGIHAGLECGYFKKAIPELDVIAVGGNIYDIHSPSEHMYLSSCDRIWNTIVELLGR